MLGRKKDKAPEPTPEQRLEQRVDAMMDPSLPDYQPPAEPETLPATKPGELPPLDIFSDPKTAPEVPKQLLKQLGADTVPGPAESDKPATDTSMPAESATSPDVDTPSSLDDAKTDAAVDEIVAQEGDTVLAAEDAAAKPSPQVAKKHRRFTGFRTLPGRWWFWLLIVIVLLGVLAAVPFTRYKLAGLLVKQSASVVVTDSSTGMAISDAVVTIDGRTAKTDAAGKASLRIPVGPTTLTANKQYYRSVSQPVTVPLLKSGTTFSVRLVATGRQVPLRVVNAITGQALSGAQVSVLGTTAKTDTSGQVTIVLPAKSPTASATIRLDGYNLANATIQITAQTEPANTFKLVPAGKVYFLSNASGRIDVVKTDLDGGNRQTVLPGTGSEDPNGTVLLASNDWHYLALLSKRDGGSAPTLYLINTDNDKLTTIDNSGLNLTPLGWSGHYFVYRSDNPNANNWQPGATAIKSYAADSGKSITLATTSATGTSNADAQYQNLWDTTFLGGYLVYDTTWYSYPGYTVVSGQQNSLDWVRPDGSGAKTLKTVDAGMLYFSGLKLEAPDKADVGVYSSGSSSATYYRLDANGNLTQSNTITSVTMNQPSPAYLVSPSGAHTFWSEVRDGKNSLFVGDQTAANATPVATASDYTPFAWYTDSYLLVSKNGSELYIMAADGKSQPHKVSDYYKPAQSYYGYGGH